MRALGYKSTTETIVGWRCWRVLPFDRLDGSWTYRLAAVGTLGVPKFWTPMAPTLAACSDYTSEHESPWPDCECGIWALERSESARRRMVGFMQRQSGQPTGWAYGRVSLWGRVIEHEHGWRGQLAYPYAITIESPDEDVAKAIRSEYAVDVEWAGSELVEKVLRRRREKEERKRQPDVSLKEKIAADLRLAREAGKTMVEKWNERAEREEAEADAAVRAKPPIAPLDDLTVDDVLVPLVACIQGSRDAHPERHYANWIQWHQSADDLASAVLWARGEELPFETPRVPRVGLREARAAVLAQLREAREAGLLEYGKLFEDRNSSRGGHWFITRKGLSRVTKVMPRTVPYYAWIRGAQTRFDVDVESGVRFLRRHPRPPFAEEVEALLPAWMKERRAAQRQGRRAYEVWLRERRKTGHPGMLWFTDDEVEAAVRRAGKPVRVVDVMNALAPTDKPGDRLKGEVARFSAQFARLRKNGRLVRRKDGSTIWWEPAQDGPEDALQRRRAAAVAAAPPVIAALAAEFEEVGHHG